MSNAAEAYAAAVLSPADVNLKEITIAKALSKVDSKAKVDSSKSEKTIETLVRTYFADTPVLAEIARCESAFRHYKKDGELLRGLVDKRDVGVMQINEYYHLSRATKLGFDIHTVEGNMAYAKVLYHESGSQPWKASSPCWGKSEKILATDASTSNEVAIK